MYGFVMCGCVYVWACDVWVYVCMGLYCVGLYMCGFVMCGCVYVWACNV